MSLFIGRQVDPSTLKPGDAASLLDPARLTQHAVCVGMTGSGKTGLCASLLEELASAGIPAIVIDPKGDMTNLALAFADARPEEFAPWIDPGEATRKGVSVEALAATTAAAWKAGRAQWGLDDARVRKFTDGAQVTVYTPGSTAGVAVDVLAALAAPPAGLADDPEGLTDLVAGTVGSLLGLVGETVDPVTDPSHIVLSRIVADCWAEGTPADLETIITRLVDPPFAKVGVFPVDTFFPRAARMKLAMSLNGIVASPGFAVWRQGSPLDVDTLLSKRGGKTPVSVLYLAHLDDGQRMFFLSLLLSRVVAWSRRQPGTGSLRALVYFDEVYGYLPPHPADPPTKRAVLTLMKQARAVGVGTMLVTQNPVDVDYKALSNAGTWLVGRLQTKQDRERVLDGLVSAAGGFDRGQVSDWLENLPPRTFVWRDVKEQEPALVHSRFAISYLRGPLTRREIEQLPEGVRRLSATAATRAAAPAAARAPAAPAPAPAPAPVPAAAPAAAPANDGLRAEPPPVPQGHGYRYLDPRVVFSPRLAKYFETAARPRRPDGKLVFEAAVHATVNVRFDEGEFVEDRVEQRLFFPITDDAIHHAGDPELEAADFLPSAPAGSRFTALPGLVDEARELQVLRDRVLEDIWRGETATLFRHKGLKLESKAGETRDDFEHRVAEAIQAKIDAEVAALKAKVDKEAERLEDRKRRLDADVARWQTEARSRKASEVASAGEVLFGLFFGNRRSVGVSGIASRRQQTMRAEESLSRAEAEARDIERDVYDLEGRTQTQILEIENKWKGLADQIVEVPIRLEREDVKLSDLCVLWVPVTRAV